MTWASATAGQHIKRALLLDMAVPSGDVVRVHDGIGALSWGGHEWLGVGQLGAVSNISGGVDMDAKDATLMLTGVPSDLRTEVLQEVARGSRVNIYQGIVNHASGGWDYEPELIFAGFVDAPAIEEEASEEGAYLTITIPVIAASSYVRRIQIWRRTDNDQQSLYPGDKFFSFKTDMRVPIATAASNVMVAIFRNLVFPRG